MMKITHSCAKYNNKKSAKYLGLVQGLPISLANFCLSAAEKED